MFERILSNPIVQFSIVAAMILGVLVCIFPQYIPSLSWGVNYAIQLMLLYLALGILMLFVRQPRLTFAFFAGCAFLCIFLKYSVKSNGLPRFDHLSLKTQPSSPKRGMDRTARLKVAHFNLTNADSIAQITKAVGNLGADLIAVHEVTPNWAGVLEDSLSRFFPYHHTMVDIGLFGMAIFSQYPLENMDTFHYGEIPNLRGCIEKKGEPFCFISVQTEPALNSYSLKRLKGHLNTVGIEARHFNLPHIVLGNFNAVTWSGEIQSFLDGSGLMESRRGFMPYPFVSTSSMFQVPLDHIFFSQHIQCTRFENIVTPGARHLGISGTYAPRKMTVNAKKTAR